METFKWQPLFECITSKHIEQAYSRLKKILLDNNCKINAEESPNYIRVTQGSIMGIQPKSAKKIISFYLSNDNSGTKIESSSKIATDWKNLTLYGSVLAAVLIGIFMWIAIDMNKYIETDKTSFWAWLAQIYGTHDSWGALLMIRVTQALSIFLALTIVFEILIVIYVYQRKNAFSRQVLEKMNDWK